MSLNLETTKPAISDNKEYCVSLYGLSLDHPQDWIVRFGKVLYREHGVMDVLEPSSKCEAIFTVMWRPYQSLFLHHSFVEDEQDQNALQKGLDRLTGKNKEIPETSDPDFNNKARIALQSYKTKVRKGFQNDFGQFKLLDDEEITLNSHYAIKETSQFMAAHGVIKRSKIKVYRQSFYYVCPESKRLMILHSSANVDKHEFYQQYFDRFLDTFCCH